MKLIRTELWERSGKMVTVAVVEIDGETTREDFAGRMTFDEVQQRLNARDKHRAN